MRKTAGIPSIPGRIRKMQPAECILPEAEVYHIFYH